nr:hypothetical protein pPsy0462a_00020 [Pseudomonas syringae]
MTAVMANPPGPSLIETLTQEASGNLSFYNPKRRHSSAMQLSPVEYEKRYFLSLESV